MESKKLKAKDLINVGIYTAIYIVIFFVVGMLNAIPVLYPFLYILIPLISGIPFMLFLTKTDKFGMVTIMSVICGVFWHRQKSDKTCGTAQDYGHNNPCGQRNRLGFPAVLLVHGCP